MNTTKKIIRELNKNGFDYMITESDDQITIHVCKDYTVIDTIVINK